MPTTTAEPLAASAVPGKFSMIPLDLVDESPRNPRKHFDKAALAELAESIRAHGVIEPVLVRPKGGRYEAVFGSRRLRASKLAGQTEIPAIVRHLSDVEALEAAVIENVQRSDVHPMEEAESYHQLLASKEKAYTVEDIAAKVGKSKAYVYARLKLTALCPEARKAFYEGSFSASVALLVARLPSRDLQQQALKTFDENKDWDEEAEPISFRAAASLIRDHFMLRLAEAPWKLDDAELLPSAGPCTICPHRSGAQPELFADLPKGHGDVCTNPPCFAEKKKAWGERTLAEAQASGRQVVSGPAAERAFGYNGSHIRPSDYCYDDPKNRTYQQLVGKKAPLVLVQTKEGLEEGFERKAVHDALCEAGHKWAEPRRAAAADSYVAREKKAAAFKRLKAGKAIARIVAAAEKKAFDEETLRFVAGEMIETSWHDVCVEVVKRRGFEVPEGKRVEDALKKLLGASTPAQVRGLVVEMFATRGAYMSYQTGDGESLKAAAKFYLVDLEKCADEAKAELKAKADAKKARAKKSAPAKKRKGAARG